MSVDIDNIIASSISSIDDGGANGGDTGDLGDAGTGDHADVLPAGAADEAADAGVEGQEADASGHSVEPDPARSADDIALEAELADLGIHRPKPGQRDNRIPHSRFEKIFTNAKVKWSEKAKSEHAAELSARDQKIKDNEERAAQFDRAEQLIATNPESYLNLLAEIYPDKYKGYAKSPAAEPQKPQEPQPDVKYDDGSLGYSPEQFAKLREYDRTEAARIAEERTSKAFNERFGPIEQEHKERQRQHEDVQRVRGHIGKLREQWGDDIIDNPEVQKAIVAHMDANPKATLVEATRTVAMGRIQVDRTKMRADLLAELKGAPKAALKAPVAPNRSDAANINESIDDIITAAARSLR